MSLLCVWPDSTYNPWVANTTILFGLLLTVLGLAGYLIAGAASVTALIPAFFGIVLLALGFLARAEAMRKHAMHAAAAVALIGFAGALMSLLRAPFATRSALANFSQMAMALLTALFVVLCIKSFRDARRARAASPPR
jgi:uncharacterized membrane protein